MATKRQKKSGTDPNLIAEDIIVMAMEKSVASVTEAAKYLDITPRQLRYLLTRNPALREECEKAANGRLRSLVSKAVGVLEGQIEKGSVKAATAVCNRAKIWDGVQADLSNSDSPEPNKVATKKSDDVWEKFVKDAPKDKDGAIVVGN